MLTGCLEVDGGAGVEPAGSAMKRVLIVDDESGIRDIVRHMLATASLETLSASDGASALLALEVSVPDLILLDVMLPDATGFALCETIKADPRFSGTPVILLTALDGVEDQVRGFAAGADDFLAKPVHLDVLLARVLAQLRNKAVRDELAAHRDEVACKNEELVRLERAKENLMHMVVHDLKNPLGAMELGIDLLQQLQSSPSKELGQTTLNNVEACASKMRTMVQNILTVAQMEHDGVRLQPEPLSFAKLLDASAAYFSGLAEARSLTYQHEVEASVPIIVADVNLVSRVLDNLMSNACRLSRKGGDLRIHVASAANGGVLVTIADRGPGVSPELRDRIFNRYVSGPRAIAAYGINQGLGLTFCKLSVNGHGGSIWVEDRKDGGALFRFTLPPLPAPPSHQEVGSSSARPVDDSDAVGGPDGGGQSAATAASAAPCPDAVARGTAVEYVIALPDQVERRFMVELDRPRVPSRVGARLPSWTELEYEQCPNCPLTRAESPHCPPAVDSLHILSAFRDALSYSDCSVRVRTGEREFVKACDIQTALRSLLGLVMATSGCPHLSSLRSLAASHLPFSNLQETVYRTTANYLLGQFFVHRRGGAADLDLVELRAFYARLELVNRSFLERVRVASTGDANLNALVNLLSVSMLVGFSLEEGLSRLESLFPVASAAIAV